MSGWYSLASAIVQYQRKIKLLKKKNLSLTREANNAYLVTYT